MFVSTVPFIDKLRESLNVHRMRMIKCLKSKVRQLEEFCTITNVLMSLKTVNFFSPKNRITKMTACFRSLLH